MVVFRVSQRPRLPRGQDLGQERLSRPADSCRKPHNRCQPHGETHTLCHQLRREQIRVQEKRSQLKIFREEPLPGTGM